MIKAAVYVRYSSDNQREESIDAQIRAIKDYANKNSYDIVKIYIDEAKSARSDDRPAFQDMIQDISSKSFEVIIVHKLDRFSRSRYDSAYYKKKLKDNNIKLISVLERLDDSPESILMESLIEGFAEYYSANLARETMKGLKENAYACKFTGGLPAFGYEIDNDKNFIINQHEATAIREIYQMYSDGKGYSHIINWLREHGYVTRQGIPFGKNSLHDLFKNEKYKGVYVYNKTRRGTNRRNSKPEEEIIRIPDGVPAIVNNDLWTEVNKKMVARKHKGAINKAKTEYLLSGLVKCVCGYSMTGNRKSDNYSVYECSYRKSRKACDNKCINSKELDELVLNELYINIFSPDKVDFMVGKIFDYIEATSITSFDECKEHKKELLRVEKDIGKIIDAITDGMYHPSMKEKLTTLEDKKKSILNLITDAEKKIQRISYPKDMLRAYLISQGNFENMDFNDKQKMVNRFVEAVIVHPENEKGLRNIEILSIVSLSGAAGAYRFKLTFFY